MNSPDASDALRILNKYGAGCFQISSGLIEVQCDVDNDHYDWLPVSDWQLAFAMREAAKSKATT